MLRHRAEADSAVEGCARTAFGWFEPQNSGVGGVGDQQRSIFQAFQGVRTVQVALGRFGIGSAVEPLLPFLRELDAPNGPLQIRRVPQINLRNGTGRKGPVRVAEGGGEQQRVGIARSAVSAVVFPSSREAT